MTEQDQRIALCEWAGWTDIHNQPFTNALHVHWEEPFGTNPVSRLEEKLPDTSSLDVLHEMEKRLKDEQIGYYALALCRVIRFPKEQDVLPVLWMNVFDYINATAAQRREALLRTLGLWREEKE